MKISAWLTHPEIPCFNLAKSQADAIERAIDEAQVQICRDRDEFIDSLEESEIVLVWTFLQEWFDLAPGLRWVVTPAAGRDYFQVEPPDGI